MQAFSSICSVLLGMQWAARSQGDTASNIWHSGELGEGGKNLILLLSPKTPSYRSGELRHNPQLGL